MNEIKRKEWIDNCSGCFKRRIVGINSGKCCSCEEIRANE